MKFAFTADIHLSRYSQDKLDDESNLPERLHSLKNTIDYMAQYCIDNDIKVMVIGGDILHGKSLIYAIAQDLMLNYFSNWPDKIKFYIIDGNHDLSGKGDKVISALKSLQTIPNITWVPHNSFKRIADGDILLVPYSYNVAKVVKENKARILISHFGLSEGILNSGMSIISDISTKDLIGKYELVLLGHYHKPQEIIRDNFSLYYVGSPIQLDWGEKGEEKRFLIVDTDTLQVDSIPLTQYRKHIEIELTNENKDTALQDAQKAKNAGNHVKVIMKEKVDLTKFEDQFRIIDKTETDITNRGINSSMSQQDRINRYIEIKEIPTEEAEEYSKSAFDIIQSCET